MARKEAPRRRPHRQPESPLGATDSARQSQRESRVWSQDINRRSQRLREPASNAMGRLQRERRPCPCRRKPTAKPMATTRSRSMPTRSTGRERNRAWCKARGIRLSGPALGRPPKDSEENAQRAAAAKAQMRADEIARIPMKGKFGNAKRGGSLSRVMAKLRATSVSVVNIATTVLNLDTRLRKLFCRLLECLLRQAHYIVAELGTGRRYRVCPPMQLIAHR